jgi:CRISPR-associated protein Cas6/Cse3/CasE subtype I-E
MNVYTIHQSLSDNYKNHQMLKELFPGEGKLLYQNKGSKLIVATDIKLDPRFENEFNIEFFVKSNELINSLDGECLFSIRLNAVKSNKSKRFSIHRDQLNGWVDKKLEGLDISYKTIKDEGIVVSDRKGKKCYHSSVLVTGFLKVGNKDVLNNIINNGIGHGKAFGFGLLNIFGT